MKSPLTYLTAVKLKNQIISVFKTPAKLIYAIFIVAMLVLMTFANHMEGADIGDPRPIAELEAILMAFFTIMFCFLFSIAFKQGAAMFTLSDVNFLFAAPLRPQKVLLYGLIRQLGMSIIVGLFIVFQYSWLNSVWGVTYGGLIAIMIAYGLVTFLAQLTAMALFVYTSSSPKQKRIVNIVFYATVVVLVGGLVLKLIPYINNLTGNMNQIIPTAVEYATSTAVMLFPVSGWLTALLSGIASLNIMRIAIFSIMIILYIVAITLLIMRAKRNFYEDVIAAAETSYSAVTAQKEGKVGEVVAKNVKVGKVGINKGEGASAIYYKHLVENRRSGVFFISNMSLIFVACIIVCAFFFKEFEDGALISIFAMGTYMQIFSVSLGRFSREMTKPFIYLIPEPPVKKLYYAVKESMAASLIEALAVFIPVMFIVGANPIDIVLCIVARVTFSFLFTAANIATERVFGAFSSKALIMLFYIVIILIMTTPGIILGAVAMSLGLVIVTEYAALFLGMIIGNILIGLLVLYLCRNVLQYTDFNG